MEITFGQFVNKLRRRKKLSLADLAHDLECSAPKLYKLEHSKYKKAIPAHFVQQLCDALTQNEAEAAEFFELAGYRAPAASDVQSIIRIVEETLRVPEFSKSSEELIAEVKAFVQNWQKMRKARLQKIRKVVIAAAGWQPRLLSLNRFERTLLPAIDEATRANIAEVLLVVPPNTPDFQLLQDTFPGTAITAVIQEEPLGLGNALLAAKEHIEAEPFAVLLADEIDTSRTALRDLLEAYNQVHKPIVAVDTYDVDEVFRYFGFAQPGEQVDSHVFALQSALVEKPQTRPGREYLRIAGRYVLTPEILRTLQNTHPVEQVPMRHDLTAAINQLWHASASVLAYKLPRAMLSIAPYRHIMLAMDKEVTFDAAAYERRAARRTRH